MTGFSAALWAEKLKARRSRAPWLTALAMSAAPLVGGLFMMILRDPEWARRSGLISTKAQITVGVADWPTYFGMLSQAIAVAGLIVYGLIAIWLFGREYGDRTAKDLLALPVSRGAIVAAKLVVAATWSVVLVVEVYVIGLGVGFAVNLPGWSPALAADSAVQLAAIAGLTILLVIPLALVASAGRGYMAPVGVMFVLMALAQIFAVLGWGAYFPWSVPLFLSGAVGPSEQSVEPASYLLVALAGTVGVAGTLAWWQWADQT